MHWSDLPVHVREVLDAALITQLRTMTIPNIRRTLTGLDMMGVHLVDSFSTALQAVLVDVVGNFLNSNLTWEAAEAVDG